MHNDSLLVEKRIEHVRTERLAPARYAERVPLELVARQVPDEPVAVGAAWGRPQSTMSLRATGTVPAQRAGKRVESVLDLGSVGKWPGGRAAANPDILADGRLAGWERSRRTATFPVPAVTIVDLLGRPLDGAPPLVLGADSVELSLRPFQVLTPRWRSGGSPEAHDRQRSPGTTQGGTTA